MCGIRQVVRIAFADVDDVELEVTIQHDAVAPSIEAASPERIEQAGLVVAHCVDIVRRPVCLAEASDDGEASDQCEVGKRGRETGQAGHRSVGDAVDLGGEVDDITRHE